MAATASVGGVSVLFRKGERKKSGPRPLVAYKSDHAQAEYIDSHVREEEGFKLPDVMRRIVGTSMHLDRRLSGHEARLEAFAVREGIYDPAAPDELWQAEAFARLILRGLDAVDPEGRPKAKK